MIILHIILEVLFIILIEVAVLAIFFFIHPKISRYYREWKWRREYNKQEKEHEEFIQQQRKWELEWKLMKEERKKYPLFYWKELTSGNS